MDPDLHRTDADPEHVSPNFHKKDEKNNDKKEIRQKVEKHS
jgi:hypothetical protein